MKSKISVFLVFVFLFATNLLAGEFVMHPVFKLLDKNSKTILDSSSKKVSELKTCAVCHDVEFINSHNSHYSKDLKVNCSECHFENSKITYSRSSFDSDGYLKKEFIKVQVPGIDNCGKCHGLAYKKGELVTVPKDYLTKDEYSLTRDRGEFFAPSKVSDSGLNLKDKSILAYPWDVHSQRGLKCISCHITSNKPSESIPVKEKLKHLKFDPRSISLGQYLNRPNHKLEVKKCESCHDPLVIHDKLAYKKRHLEELACQSCHSQSLSGLALKVKDETIVNLKGEPRVEFRSEEDYRGEPFNVYYSSNYLPYLFEKTKRGSDSKLNPYNLITNWFFKDNVSGEKVPIEIIKKAYLKGDSYRKDVLKVFDENNNGNVDIEEAIIDSNDKKTLIISRLKTLGVKKPEIFAQTIPFEVNHGIVRGKWIAFKCSNCHGNNSRFSQDILLADKIVGSVVPEIKGKNVNLSGAGGIVNRKGKLYIERKRAPGEHYILGFHRSRMLDMFGLVIFLMTVLGVVVHAGARVSLRKAFGPQGVPSTKMYLYNVYERVWHWVSALGIILLMITGFEIHFSGDMKILGIERSVYIHNVLAFILITNAFLSLFYNVVSTEIKQFVPPLRSFMMDAYLQARYYLYGIFKGEHHPLAKTKKRKLNPLQQVTYLILLNVLIPLQVLTGILMWGLEKWPTLATEIGGLKFIAPFHALGSWFLLSFLIMHVYLTTTGYTLTSNVEAMITGYDFVEEGEDNTSLKES